MNETQPKRGWPLLGFADRGADRSGCAPDKTLKQVEAFVAASGAPYREGPRANLIQDLLPLRALFTGRSTSRAPESFDANPLTLDGPARRAR